MKHFLILAAVLLQAFFVSAQQGRGRGQNQGQAGAGGQNQTMPPFKIDNAIGIIDYDIYDVFEKLKIESDTEIQGVAKAISAYSATVNDIKLTNSKKLNEVEQLITEAQKDAMTNAMHYVQTEANKQLNPIKREVDEADKMLNLNLKGVLSEKKHKKWLKYQSSKKASLKPKQSSSMQGGGGGQRERGGGGGRGY